jgi:hypothetical protein
MDEGVVAGVDAVWLADWAVVTGVDGNVVVAVAGAVTV